MFFLETVARNIIDVKMFLHVQFTTFNLWVLITKPREKITSIIAVSVFPQNTCLFIVF